MFKKYLVLIIVLALPLSTLAKTLLIVGDSLSAGYGIDVSKGWVALLQKRLNAQQFKVVNASASGDTTQNGLNKLPPLLKQYHPDITIIQLGANDGLRGLSLITMKNNLIKMTELAKAQHSQVLLLGVPLPPNYGADYITRFRKVFSDVAQSQHIPLVKNIIAKFNLTTMMQNDGLHPNTRAQPQLLNNIWPTLQIYLRSQ